MTKKSMILSSLYALVVVGIGAVVIISTEQGIPRAPKLTISMEAEPIPSESCIACHTDEDIITAMADLDSRDGGHGGEGG